MTVTACGSSETEETAGETFDFASSPAVSETAETSAAENVVTGTLAEETPTESSGSAESAADSSAGLAVSTLDVVTSEAMTDDGSVPASLFETSQGLSYTYESLYDIGLANTLDSVSYALVPEDGAAGSLYYQVYYTENGGWVKGDMIQLPSGDNTYFALDDGRILLFSAGGAASSDFPFVEMLTLVGNKIGAAELNDYWSGLTAYDGTPLSNYPGCSFWCTYDGGYSFTFNFSDGYGTAIYSGSVTIDPNTLRIVV